jgi:uncharacterized YccA/Bax inhibitor family protein
MRTANPALNAQTFVNTGPIIQTSNNMTLSGTINKTGFCLLLLCLTASWVWSQFNAAVLIGGPSAGMAAATPWLLLGTIGGLVVAIFTVFKKTAAPITAPLYSLVEGLAVGGISAMFEARFPGIVIQAVGLTFCTCFGLLLAYRSGLIKVTQNFRLGVFAATGGIMFFYLISFMLSFMGISVPLIHGSGLMGIGFSLFVVAIAAMNLVLDFDFIESGVEQGAPKYMEWYAAFGLMVTLVWLYIEILRLLSKLRSRN